MYEYSNKSDAITSGVPFSSFLIQCESRVFRSRYNGNTLDIYSSGPLLLPESNNDQVR